jgi:hypothetical protein
MGKEKPAKKTACGATTMDREPYMTRGTCMYGYKNFMQANKRERGCLVPGVKIFEYHVECFMECRKGYSDTNKKTNCITRLKTTRQIY